MTVANLLTAVLRRIHVVQAGEEPTADDQADAFLRLNDLMDAWQTERLTIYTITRTVFAITANQRDYSVGGARPVFIDHVNYQDTSTSPVEEYPLRPLTPSEWAAVPLKTLTAPLPQEFYYESTYLTGTLSLWPTPTSTTLQGVLYAPNAVQQFASVNDTISLPPGYQRFLRDNLAVELWPEWREGIPIDPGLVRSAIESKAQIKRANMRLEEMSIVTPWTSGMPYDINADQ